MLVYALVLIFAMVLSNNPVIKRWFTSFTSLFRRKHNITLFAEESRNAYAGSKDVQADRTSEPLVVVEEEALSDAKAALPVLEDRVAEAEPAAVDAEAGIQPAAADTKAEDKDIFTMLYTADGTPLDEESMRRIQVGLMLYDAYGDIEIGDVAEMKQRKEKNKKSGKKGGGKA